MTAFALIISVIAFIFSSITVIFSFLAYSRVVGLENSTHQIQYVDPTGPTGSELAKQFMDQKTM